MKRRAPKRRAAQRATSAEPWRRLLLASLPALAFLLGCTPMSDFDVWWHLRTGQLILQSGAVPRVDLFTYTNATRPWIDVHWLFQVGLALLYGAGGASALVLVKATAGAAIVGLSLLARQPQQRAWPVALAWLPGVLMLSGRLSERPELVSLVLLAVYLAVLARAPQKPRWLWLLPAAQLLWVNCHGFFVMGPLVLAAYTAEWIVERLRPPAIPAERPPARTFAVVAAACAVACLVNPYGLAAVGFSFEQFQKVGPGLYRSTIGELKSAGDFIAAAGVGNPYLLAYFASVLLGVASFVACARRGRFSLYRALLFGAGAYLGWQATRNNGLCAVIAAFVTTWNFDDAGAPPPTAHQSPRRRAPPFRTVRRNRPVAGRRRDAGGVDGVRRALLLGRRGSAGRAWASARAGTPMTRAPFSRAPTCRRATSPTTSARRRSASRTARPRTSSSWTRGSRSTPRRRSRATCAASSGSGAATPPGKRRWASITGSLTTCRPSSSNAARWGVPPRF